MRRRTILSIIISVCLLIGASKPEEAGDLTKKGMISDIVATWEIAFQEDHIRIGDPRRARFQEYATYIAEKVFYYQTQPISIGGKKVQLPTHRSSHMIMAITALKESALKYRIVGKLFHEIGIFQLHGVALNGYRKRVVRYNPKLGIDLGVRWLTAMIPECRRARRKIHKHIGDWETRDWLGPVSVYGAGPKKVRKPDGTCRVFSFARRRVRAIRYYTKKIDKRSK